MGIKNRMMKNMMNRFMHSISADEKQKMMNDMMEKFFSGMTKEEKQKMMETMMSGMNGSGFNMMDMMKKMMGGMSGDREGGAKGSGHMGFNPMEMCHKMMMRAEKSDELASYATPEVRALFEEWAEQIEEEICSYINETDTTDPEILAEHFKLSKNSINFFLSKLAQKDKIKLKAEKK